MRQNLGFLHAIFLMVHLTLGIYKERYQEKKERKHAFDQEKK